MPSIRLPLSKASGLDKSSILEETPPSKLMSSHQMDFSELLYLQEPPQASIRHLNSGMVIRTLIWEKVS